MARKLIVEIVGDTSSLEKSFRQTEAATNKFDRSLGQTTRGAIVGTGAFRSLGRSVAFASSGFIGGVGLVAAMKASVSAASNLNEQTSKTAVVFGQSAGEVERWSNTAVNAMGLASDQALETASSFGALLRPIGLTGVAAAQQSERLTQLGADLASFYNTSVQDALDAIRSGLVGESEPLRRYGVLLSETRVQQQALSDTGKTNAKELTNQDKVLARITLTYKDAAKAQGDFARTSGGLANQQRILAANVRQLEIALGQKLVPTLTTLVQFLNSNTGAFKTLFHIAQFASPLSFVPAILKGVNGGGNQTGIPGLTGPAGTPGTTQGLRGPIGHAPPPASLTFQLSILQERLAKAELTATQRDDRAILVRIAALTRQKIAKTKELGERTRLTDTLVGVESQIASIDQQAADSRKSRREKELAARQKEPQQALAAYKKTQAQAAEILAAAKARVKAQAQALKDAADVVRSALGGIFTGPVFNAPAGVLGVSNARGIGSTIGAGGFVSNLRQQTAQLVAFNNDLARLARRGAPGGLISQLRQGGLEQGPLIHQLATAGRPTLRSLFRAFAQQEKVVQQIAHADVQAKTVTIVTSSLSGRATTPSTQRRGRQAGVPASIGSYINP